VIPLWNDLAAKAGVALDEARHDLLNRYLDLLIAGNEKMNLTRITDRGEAEVRHIGDALTVLPFLPARVHRLVDVGTGGGVPGIPLAIARPDAQVLLVESTAKKAIFLRETIAELKLTNVRVDARRAEDVGRSSRESFDVAVARAVATLEWLAEWLLPLVKTGGVALAMKGAKVSEEMPAAARPIRMLGGGPAEVIPVALPGTEHHAIVRIPKIVRTPHRYPRPATMAKGQPLE
jgi:16S rRNA (guanine527-N7)-methyltransferase